MYRPTRSQFSAAVPLLGLFLLMASYGVLRTPGAEAETTFMPTTAVHQCNSLSTFYSADPSLAGAGTSGAPDFTPGCAEVLANSANPDINTIFHLNSGDAYTSDLVTFTPSDYTIGTGLAAGTTVGGHIMDTQVAIFNGPCNGPTTVQFILYSVALPNNADPRLATNIAWPMAEDVGNRYQQWAVGNGNGGGLGAYSPFATVSTFYAASSATPIQNYPGYLLNHFDPDYAIGTGDNADGGPNLAPVVPIALYGGVTNVAGTWWPQYFAQFAAGALAPLGGAYGGMGAAMGQPSVSVFLDPTEAYRNQPTLPTSTQHAIRLCTTLTTETMLLGDPAGGGERVKAPSSAAADTQFHLQYAVSLRDIDQDGYENAIDTCPFVANDGDPRALTGAGTHDEDSDGLDDACDPTPAVDTAGMCDIDGPGGDPPAANPGDHEGDCFQNRLDICPLAANGTIPSGGPGHRDFERWVLSPAGDNGPSSDEIGDVCDDESSPAIVTQNNQTFSITLKDHSANGRYLSAVNVVAKCILSVTNDNDGDGYCDDRDNQDTGACGAFVGSFCNVRHQKWNQAGHPLSAAGMLDSDSDGWADHKETQLTKSSLCVGTGANMPAQAPPAAPPCTGTNYIPRVDPNHSCAQAATANNEHPYDNWPLDFNDGQQANTGDLFGFTPRLNQPVNADGSAAGKFGDERFDLNQDGFINTTDMVDYYALTSVPLALNKTCSTIVPSIPPFFQN